MKEAIVARRVVIAGAHGQVGLRLGRLLAERGDEVVGIVRNPGHVDDLRAAGVEPTVLDLERASVAEVAAVLSGAHAAVFAAGAGPGSGPARKDTVDRAAAALLADACELAGVRRYLLVSSMGVESVRGGGTPDGLDEVFVAYLRAKLAAEEDLRGRELDWTVLRPGRLTDDPGSGHVRLEASVPRGDVPRDDVAAVLAALLDDGATAGAVLEVVGGELPVDEAVRRVVL
ncbi:NAD(P)H-binding protein [Motilibacter deserti]|uniref:NAD(P)H-binding protein n=1 Tax=Motilibacter deserti TaxID=2714956 RepID=A0ABX0GXP6_9ACTN|nr:NAD(P)H-binding protein [Motilibacter deserti]NHC14357.1 NAD(P)H-binding protein [Motilibacter deserti]